MLYRAFPMIRSHFFSSLYICSVNGIHYYFVLVIRRNAVVLLNSCVGVGVCQVHDHVYTRLDRQIDRQIDVSVPVFTSLYIFLPSSEVVWHGVKQVDSERPELKSHFHSLKAISWSCYFISQNFIFLMSKMKIIISALPSCCEEWRWYIKSGLTLAQQMIALSISIISRELALLESLHFFLIFKYIFTQM